MASNVTHLPHIRNVAAGINLWDPMYSAIFEVYFTVPDAIAEGEEQTILLLEQVEKVEGLDALQHNTAASSQKFLGVDVSYLQPTLETTVADITITFNLNLREANDAYTLKVFKKWQNLNYDLSNGSRSLKVDYVADNLRIAEANRDGTIWRSFIFHDILLTGVEGLNDLDYTAKEARHLVCHFRSDYWDETIA